ncbi:hypothetical protein ACFFF5_21135 [Lederbergia wuyishanensis]|uniref:Uncharacterized protein n=1 Tax=Lederbergia wuyishanensis TaxID=1347903 RepID=A0ABU0D792_9BACI|nr:hypothetical protein [Lederbergia wuyishanensis]MCJ8008921.1 hypothetical protein [Lederbergia wuyishanensis]MDQ0344247.1 hypothetical protein [Lederbergia wuyishanensis]
MNEHLEEFKRLKEWCIKCPIEAAMRIEEQQREIKTLCDSVMIQTRKAEQLRESLEFYADNKNHYVEYPDIDMNEVEKDGGEKARQALEESK